MEYEQGSSQRIYATFVDQNGAAASVSGTPIVTIMHMQGNATVYDVNEANMIQLSGVVYYYPWHIPERAYRTTYTAKFDAVICGTAFAPTYAVGATDFQVITRKFYNKKGGGFVQRAVPKPIWTEKEKNEIIEAIESLLNRAEFKEIKTSISSISEALSAVTDELREKATQKDTEGTKNVLTVLASDIEAYKGKFSSFETQIKALSEKKGYDDSKVIQRLTGLSQSIIGLDQDIRNERITLVITELEDIKKELTEFEGVFAKSLPTKEVEMRKNEYEGHNTE